MHIIDCFRENRKVNGNRFGSQHGTVRSCNCGILVHPPSVVNLGIDATVPSSDSTLLHRGKQPSSASPPPSLLRVSLCPGYGWLFLHLTKHFFHLEPSYMLFPPLWEGANTAVGRNGWFTHQGEKGGQDRRPREDGPARHHKPLLRESSAGLAEPRPEHVDGGLALHLQKKMEQIMQEREEARKHFLTTNTRG